MNLIVFNRMELEGENRLVLSGERAEHVISTLGSGVGDSLRVGVIGGGIGSGRVEEVAAGRVVLEVDVPDEPAEQPKVDVILALARPQIMKRVFQTCAALGVGRLFLIRSHRVEKSFFHSPLLEEENRNHFLRLGLEQGMNTHLPQVSIHERFRPFIEDVVDEAIDPGMLRLVAHPSDAVNIANICRSSKLGPGARIVVAIGPEGGWVDYELKAFSSRAFIPVCCSKRIMTVDMAVCALLSQLEVLETIE